MDKNQQEIMYQLAMLEQQIQHLQQQLQAVEESNLDLNTLLLALDDLKGSVGKEVMAPLGRGIFVKTKLLSEDLVVDIGGRNLVGKSITDTKKIISEQIEKLNQIKKELIERIEESGKELTRIISKEESGEESIDEDEEEKED